MKHYNNHSQQTTYSWLRLAALAWIAFLPFTLSAQNCNLACNGTQDFPVQVVIDQSCQVAISTNVLVPDLPECPGPKRLMVRDLATNLIADATDFVQFSTQDFVGQNLTVTISDQATGTICVSVIQVVDNLPPSISNCTELTVSCLDNTSPEVVGFPTFSDNCSSGDALALDFIENFSIRDCLSDTAGVILRDWTVTDENGLTANCTQRINILRATAMDVSFPADVNLPCDDPSADPGRTGVPELNDMPLMHGDLCGLNVSFTDDTTFICSDYMYRIERSWTVVENCTDFFEQQVQTILINDEQGPDLTCPSPAQLVFSSDANTCSATISLPSVSAIDNCGSNITYAVSSSYGASSFDPVSGVLPGTYTVQYQATDECGNPSSCSVQLTVIDDLAPVAACDDQMLVSIPSGGYAIMLASSFDEGSTDNCNSVFFRAKRNDNGACEGVNGDDNPNQTGNQEWFDNRVLFCCEDVAASPISVTLRVYAVDPGTNAVDPSRETGNGDLVGTYTDCVSLISLQDGAPPQFNSCPADLTIFCGDEQDNLSIYGSPEVQDNCGFTLDSTVVVTNGSCGESVITRTWTATDNYEQSSSCSQVITVENNQALSMDDIIWPENIILEECGASTEIEDLPLASQEPIINWEGCGNLGINHTESLFNTVAGACFKVLRTWTIIDWCTYDTESPNGPGRFVHTQIIKVVDLTSPELTCPPSVTVSVGPDCATGAATLALPSSEDCSTQISYTNNSLFANSNGADASGNYPLGVTTVQFIANDGCTNSSYCTTTVTVQEDQTPNIACILGLTVTLMHDPNGGGTGMLEASALVASSDDNCTPTSLLKHTISRPGDGTVGLPTASTVIFDCFDANTAAEVMVWVEDLEGNFSSCTTVVSVQDHNDICLDVSGNGMIAGGVLTEDGQEVENVMIMVSGTTPTMMYTELDGSFMFDALALGDDYSVSAQNNEDLLNGVTTYDLVLMSKHVLGTRILDSPYKMIAADIDRSGHISTLDIIKLRKLILNIDNALPNGNSSWRFVDASYVFPDPANPFMSYFPEIYNVNNLNGQEMHADFVAVKVGDVNSSATPNSLMGDGDNRSSDYPLSLQVNDQTVEAGQTIDITFSAEYMEEWMGYQFTLEFDPAALVIEEIVTGDLPNLYSDENFHFFDASAGLLTTVWNEYGESAQQKNTTLFTLHCQAQQAGQIKDWIYLSSRVTKAEAYTQEGESQEISLSFASEIAEVVANFELFQNRPNPWSNTTVIPFQLNEAGEANMSVYDMAGKLVYQTQGQYSEGYHEINISRDDLPAAGLFYYTLAAGNRKATMKMVLH